MCGRYYLPMDDDELEIQRILEQVKDRYKNTLALEKMKLGEIYPSYVVPVITSDAPELMKWGFPRYDGKGQVVNARLETTSERPMFRKSFAEQRCLIPAKHYFEWKKDGTQRQKYAIGTEDLLYMAGIYRFDESTQIPSFVILTRDAAPGIAFIHDRMPVILTKDTHEDWLSKYIGTSDILNQPVEQFVYCNVQ